MSSSPAVAPTRPAGRRERNIADKQRRIFDAAAELFDRHGFEAVITQQIADRADVAAGTVFRYAASKAELLLMVYNERLRAAIRDGLRAADGVEDPVRGILAIIGPIVALADVHPENALCYQRELIFGEPGQAYRAQGISLVVELEAAIAHRLGGDSPDPGAQHAARSVFAVVSLLLAQPATGVGWGLGGAEELHDQIGQIVAGYRVSTGIPTGGAASRDTEEDRS